MPARGTVVIVTYNARDIISRCLNSLRHAVESGFAKVVLVDNASTDGTAEFIADQFPWVTLVRSGFNCGFGAGNNLSLEHLEGDWCFFLNPDATVTERDLESMAEYLGSNPQVGCIGPSVKDENGNKTLSYYPFTKLLTSIWSASGLNKVLPLNKTDGRWELRSRPPDGIVEVDRVLGAAMMVPRKLFERSGGFDERFFLYSEEEDLCLRIRKAGLKVVYYPGAEVVHIGGDTTRHNKPLATASANWSRYLFMRKHYSKAKAEISRWVWLFGLTLRCFITMLVCWGRGRKDRIAGYRLSTFSLLKRGYFDMRLRPPRKDSQSSERSA